MFLFQSWVHRDTIISTFIRNFSSTEYRILNARYVVLQFVVFTKTCDKTMPTLLDLIPTKSDTIFYNLYLQSVCTWSLNYF